MCSVNCIRLTSEQDMGLTWSTFSFIASDFKEFIFLSQQSSCEVKVWNGEYYDGKMDRVPSK